MVNIKMQNPKKKPDAQFIVHQADFSRNSIYCFV